MVRRAMTGLTPVPKAWEASPAGTKSSRNQPDNQIMPQAQTPAAIASNAFLKLCKLDVGAETERWARTGMPHSLLHQRQRQSSRWMGESQLSRYTLDFKVGSGALGAHQ